MNPDNHPATSGEPEKTLNTLIEAAGTTQRQLSRDTSIAEVTINTWTAGRKMPRLDNAVVVAAQLRVSLRTLAKALHIDTSLIPGDYDLIDLKKLAADLGIERVEDLPEDYQILRRRRDRQN
jgi:transcriptional regulator with XRE-family HTH domain